MEKRPATQVWGLVFKSLSNRWEVWLFASNPTAWEVDRKPSLGQTSQISREQLRKTPTVNLCPTYRHRQSCIHTHTNEKLNTKLSGGCITESWRMNRYVGELGRSLTLWNSRDSHRWGSLVEGWVGYRMWETSSIIVRVWVLSTDTTKKGGGMILNIAWRCYYRSGPV